MPPGGAGPRPGAAGGMLVGTLSVPVRTARSDSHADCLSIAHEADPASGLPTVRPMAAGDATGGHPRRAGEMRQS